jgi:tRNA dimethylallyltransferase
VHHERLARRFETMMAAGFLDEVRGLRDRGDLTAAHPSMRAVGYRQLWGHLDGRYGLEEAGQRAVAATRQLAKRQLTWMRAERRGEWLDPQSQSSWNRDICRVLATVGFPGDGDMLR